MATDQTLFDLDVGPDLDVIARQVVAGKAKRKGFTPAVEDLANEITQIQLEDTIKGSSTLTITVRDDNFTLLDGGFFDNDQDGKIDAIDLNYPEDSRFWWRLTQCNPKADQTIELVWMEQRAVHLMQHKGPLKVSRAKMTAAEFLKFLCGHIKKRGGIAFISHDLHIKQPIATDGDKPAPKTRKATKDKGINTDSKVTFTNWDGSSYTLKPGELANAETVVDAAGDIDERPLLALLCACIVEGPFFRNPNQANSDGDSAGILQLRAMHGPESQRRDIAWSVGKFLNDGFTGKGGAIAVAKANKGMSVGEIAQTVQGSAYPDRYDKVKDGAEKVLQAAGGAGSGGGSHTKQYNFEVGSSDNPNENFWDAANRIADERKWPFFLDGDRAYYDPETTLIKQKPVLVLDRDDDRIVDWSITWDQRQIATEMSLDLICDPFEFRAGEVFQLERFGPASTGSTLTKKYGGPLPGRWLIQDIERSRFSFVSTFTLKQPEDPEPEPASATVEDSDGGSVEGGDLYAACKKISDEGHSYPHPDVHHGPWKNITKDTPLDCSESSYYALHLAGYYDGAQAQVSGVAASSFGSPGPGDEWSVYANGGHMFIQSEGSGKKWRFDTGGPGGGNGPRLHEGPDAHRPTGGFTARHVKAKAKGSKKDDSTTKAADDEPTKAELDRALRGK